MKSTPILLAVLAMSAAGGGLPASALEPIPDTPGWRGFVVLGAGYTELRSNFVAGNPLVSIGNREFDSLGARPKSDDTVHPIVTGELNYTFDTGWQVFFGTSLEDAVTLDGVTQLGARKDLGAAGIVQGGFLFSGVPTETWEDPYAEGVRRKETDRDSRGVRLRWDRVMASAFELTLTYRDISIDTERSGQGVLSVSCDAACQDLLRRDGDQYSLDVSYLYRLGPGRNHLLRPLLRYTIDERDGDAVAGDAYRLQLSYSYVTQAYMVVSNVAFGSTSNDARNPIFGVKTDSDRFAIDTTLFYRLPVTGGRWQAVASVLWAEDDSDVRFHDSELFMFSLGALYRFGAR
jgi:hypothetical protein